MEIYNKIKEKFTESPRSVATKEDKEKEKGDEKEELESICLLFPTYATRSPDGQSTDNEWKIRIRGWAFSAPKKSKTRSIFLGLTSLALQKDDERFQYLESRTSYFWTSNADQGEFTVQVEGLTESNKMSIEGDPNDLSTTTVEPHGEGSTLTTTTKFNVPDVNKVLSQTGKMISAPFQSGIDTIKATIAPKSGHFFGDLAVQKDIVVKWCDEQSSESIVGGLISSVVGSSVKEDKARLLKIKVYKDGADPHYGVVNLVEPEGVSIISDIDDTIKDTNILHGAKRVLSNTFLQPFRDVPGMSDVYRNFHQKGASIHYVSNSPWQLFPSLRTFFDTYNFPPGSAHFKFYDGLIKSAYEQKENPMASKFKYIRELLKDFPNRKFVLIGDTGELDPEIYTTIARENPGRILRIYVRDVTTEHVKDLPPQKPKHSYTQTFPTIYNYLRNHYSEEAETSELSGDKKGEAVADQVITQQAAAATSGETTETITDPNKPERKSSLTNRLLDKLHVDMSYLYGTTITDSPDSIDSSSTKPKTPLSARILSPERAASMSSKLSKLRSSSSDKSGSANKAKDDGNSSDEDKDKDDKEELKTPLQMFKERLQLLRQDIPDDLFHTFTDAKDIENDPAIRKELNYSE